MSSESSCGSADDDYDDFISDSKPEAPLAELMPKDPKGRCFSWMRGYSLVGHMSVA